MPDTVCTLDNLVLPIEPEPLALNLSVGRGEVLLLDGGMGSGKSTLLKLICGLIRPRRGSVRLFGEDIAMLSQRKLTKLRQRLGAVFEKDGLIASWSVQENLMLPLRYRAPKDRHLNEKKIRDGLIQVGESPDLLPLQVTQLTSRQRRRLALLRVLILEPELMVLDELPTYLDADEAETTRILQAMNRADSTLIASAPASWSRLFQGRKVTLARLDSGGG